jgi:formylmethanofuran dehydrogenase subunit A
MIRLKGGRVFDPAHGIDGEVRDVYIEDGRIVATPGAEVRIAREYDVTGRVVMAGAARHHAQQEVVAAEHRVAALVDDRRVAHLHMRVARVDWKDRGLEARRVAHFRIAITRR